MWFLTLLSIINEILPVAQLAVHAVESAAPQGTAGADKFQAATKAVQDTVNATGAVAGAFAQTKAALDSGKSADVASAIGQSIEVALSVSKTFGLFPKAQIVQDAQFLANNPPG